MEDGRKEVGGYKKGKNKGGKKEKRKKEASTQVRREEVEGRKEGRNLKEGS